MTWTAEQIEQIPEVYRDFMLVLKSIPDSRDSVLKITGIPLGRIYGALQMKYDYDFDQIRAVADTLKERGFVEVDSFGFFKPSGEGEALIRAIAEVPGVPAGIPPFPRF
jgi:hypothetical protein